MDPRGRSDPSGSNSFPGALNIRERERVHKERACFRVAINAVVEQHAFKVNKKFNPIRILCKTTWTTLRSGVGGKKKHEGRVIFKCFLGALPMGPNLTARSQ